MSLGGDRGSGIGEQRSGRLRFDPVTNEAAIRAAAVSSENVDATLATSLEGMARIPSLRSWLHIALHSIA